MKKSCFVLSVVLSLIFISCNNYKRLITDEVVLKDGNTQTGTLLKSDSVSVRIKKIDESLLTIPWNTIDSVRGKKFKTFWFGTNIGIYNTPYFSIFRNESYSNTAGGIQFKIGMAYRERKMYYFHYTFIPTAPYPVNKFGVGFHRYVFGNYLQKRNNFFVGVEVNGMGIRYNNGLQFSYEPFTGFELRLSQHFRMHVKFALQFNVFNKNNQTGASLSIGTHIIKRNFKRYYNVLNQEHRLLRK